MDDYMKNYNGFLDKKERGSLYDKAVENVSKAVDDAGYLSSDDKRVFKEWIKQDFASLDDFSLKIMGNPETVQTYFNLVQKNSVSKAEDVQSLITCVDAAEFFNDVKNSDPISWDISNAFVKGKMEREKQAETPIREGAVEIKVESHNINNVLKDVYDTFQDWNRKHPGELAYIKFGDTVFYSDMSLDEIYKARTGMNQWEYEATYNKLMSDNPFEKADKGSDDFER